jgi:hypothetical protein
VRLDPDTLGELTILFAPTAYVRVTRMVHAPTPLGSGYGASRFASPHDAFKVMYAAENLTTALAETVVRDRFQSKARRRLREEELALWGATTINTQQPLTLIDLRTTGLLRLGVSTDAARAKVHAQGRKLSQALHDQTDIDGVVYASRLTGANCICTYERATAKLLAAPLAVLPRLSGLTEALLALSVTVVPSGPASR